MTEPFDCRLDGAKGGLAVEATGLATASEELPYVDIDGVEPEGHDVTLRLADGTTRVISAIGPRYDEFVTALGEAWRRRRRASLLVWTGDAPIDEYVTHTGETSSTVVLFPDGLTVEGWSGAPQVAPFGLIDNVERDGYRITVSLRGSLAPVVVRGLGPRTDEFLADLDRARSDAVARVSRSYAALSEDLDGFTAPDGWAVTQDQAGAHWAALRTAVGRAGRETELTTLARIAGSLRLGVKLQKDGEAMPFVLAAAGSRIAVESTSSDKARATFVFETDDVDRLNAVLVLTSFRREAISSPPEDLGRWAPAVRLLESVQWARNILVDRVVHDATWEQRIAGALTA